MIVCARHTNGKSGCLGNQRLALSQWMARGIQPGLIATFQRWKELGRYVRRGEKAITLCRLGTVERTTTRDEGTEETHAATWFVYCPFWFVLAQTSSYLGVSKSLIADRRRAVIATAGPRSPSM
jgi:antirestriction protein ArdC